MADMVGGVVETVGEEPEPESEDMPEPHEEEEVTKASFLVEILITSSHFSFGSGFYRTCPNH